MERWLCIKDEGESETADEPVGGAKLALTPTLHNVAVSIHAIQCVIFLA